MTYSELHVQEMLEQLRAVFSADAPDEDVDLVSSSIQNPSAVTDLVEYAHPEDAVEVLRRTLGWRLRVQDLAEKGVQLP